VSAPCRDKSKKKVQGAEEQNKPGIEALGRVDSRLNGCVAWDKKKRGGYPFTIHLLFFNITYIAAVIHPWQYLILNCVELFSSDGK
jgi:hypothetical protein